MGLFHGIYFLEFFLRILIALSCFTCIYLFAWLERKKKKRFIEVMTISVFINNTEFISGKNPINMGHEKVLAR